MKKVLAISGGVDSMVMLDFLAAKYPNSDLVVAHFDHGTRPSSKDDYKFVEKCCKNYNIKFEGGKGALGEGVSEEKARIARYDFLYRVAEKYDAEIYTAHHLDDLIETVAINFVRGTGYRGLAPMSAAGISRPFIEMGWAKKDILKYAAEKQVKFREDPTNSSDEYLRNRLRKNVREMDESTKRKIYELYLAQKNIASEVDEILETLMPENGVFERKWFYGLDENVAVEILRFALIKNEMPATRPQILDFLNAIKTYAPSKKFNLPGDKLVRINKSTFEL